MQLLLDALTARLTREWQAKLLLHRGPRVVSIHDNYDALGYPPQGAARDARYTRYVDQGHLLRTQTSAAIPPALRTLGESPLSKDTLIASPGLVWRRDVVDRLHLGELHQLDLWRVSEQEMTDAHLQEMIALVVETLLPGVSWRANEASHPYTLHGREIEVLINEEWIELGECGLAHPRLLVEAGLQGVSGLAMGLGLDRAVMLRKGIGDIRLLRSPDERVSAQMLDLETYQEVSDQPAAKRDLSLAVPAGWEDEDLGDRIREALGPESEWVEEVSLLSRTPAQDLPDVAQGRLGIAADQENLLVRVLLRHPTRSLPKDEANRLRDRIYGALHQGTVHDWIVGPPAM
jgi:phenylalanyl-tRNA synthetase alpha chain